MGISDLLQRGQAITQHRRPVKINDQDGNQGPFPLGNCLGGCRGHRGRGDDKKFFIDRTTRCFSEFHTHLTDKSSSAINRNQSGERRPFLNYFHRSGWLPHSRNRNLLVEHFQSAWTWNLAFYFCLLSGWNVVFWTRSKFILNGTHRQHHLCLP